MNIDLSKLRNRTIDATVKVITKAKSKDPVDRIIQQAQQLSADELTNLFTKLTDLVKETDNA